MLDLVNITINVIAITIAGRVLPGVHVKGIGTALIIALLLGLTMPLIAPCLVYLTVPVNMYSLGIVAFLMNSLLVVFASAIVPGFLVESIAAAMLFCFVSSMVHVLLSIALASV